MKERKSLTKSQSKLKSLFTPHKVKMVLKVLQQIADRKSGWFGVFEDDADSCDCEAVGRLVAEQSVGTDNARAVSLARFATAAATLDARRAAERPRTPPKAVCVAASFIYNHQGAGTIIR